MANSQYDQDWVDRYVRSELDDDELAAFELAMMESETLQSAVEEALALRELLTHDAAEAEEDGAEEADSMLVPGPPSKGWQPLALAASLVLAVFSTVMFWRVGNEAQTLRLQVDALSQPVSSVLEVPLDIMRSGNADRPDLIIRKPGAGSLMRLSVELTPQAREIDELTFSLANASGETLTSWKAAPQPDGRVAVLLRPELLPPGFVKLNISDTDGEPVDSRLLEFLPPEP